jgi:signal transduction histidine kinase
MSLPGNIHGYYLSAGLPQVNVPLILIICIVFLAFHFFVIRFYRSKIRKIMEESHAQKKDFFYAAMHLVDFDRERISKNIHDEIGTMLSIIKLDLSKISAKPEDPGQTALLSEECLELLERTIQNTRQISKDLSPHTLIKLGYESGVGELCRQISLSGSIEVTVKRSAREKRLSPLLELQAYRVVQEVLNNLIKHAKPTEIMLSLRSDEAGVLTGIRHNGAGISGEQVKRLMDKGEAGGLMNIEKRLELINGNIRYETNAKGSSVTIEILR